MPHVSTAHCTATPCLSTAHCTATPCLSTAHFAAIADDSTAHGTANVYSTHSTSVPHYQDKHRVGQYRTGHRRGVGD
eukprot:3941091-Rhodomonas_salina.2